MIWKILDIEQTKDEETIKSAYRKKLRYVNPEDDEEGFKELRRAYEEALEYASREETDSLHNVEESEEQSRKKKTEVDLWIDRIDRLYVDVKDRRDEEKWNQILHDPVCDDLDTELEAAEKLLAYFMSHAYMPHSIWQLVDKRFQYRENIPQLKERFPENYLDYVKWQIENPGFIDYELFDGKTDDNVDEYINKLYEEKSAFEDADMKTAKRLLHELDSFDLKHPFTQVEWARYQMAENTKESIQKALETMEDLDFEFSDNPYIERIYAEALAKSGNLGKALQIYENLIEQSPDNYSAMLGKARCIFLEGRPEEAKELVEDVLEDRVQDTESLNLLDEINDCLVAEYETSLREKKDRDMTFKLGWCYYQKKEFEKGIALLDGVEAGEDYDYINLRCRLYLAAEDYEKAFPLAEKWTAMIEECKDDGSKEAEKRKNRLSLAHFSMGICLWELIHKKPAEGKKETNSRYEEADSYIKKAIEEENNQLVRLSYMEQLARFYLEEKRYEECIDICDRIVEKDRGFYPAYVHRQKANYELKNAKEVIDDYYICRDIYPGYSRPYILAAEVFTVFDQYDDVEEIIKAGEEAELDSDSLELYRIKCLHYKEFSQEHVREALQALLKLKEKMGNRSEEAPTDIEDLSELERELAILYWDQDRTDAAMQVINTYLHEHPGTISLMHLKADILTREQKYDEALDLCREVVRLEPDNLYNRNRVGNCYERMNDTDEAIKCYKEILEENPRYVPALRRLMYIYSYLNDETGNLEHCRTAIQYATKFIEISDSAEGYVERCSLYIDLYELEKAVEDGREAIRLDPEAFYAYNNLGCALLKLRRLNEAVEPLKQAIVMAPNKDHLPYLNLAECYAVMGSYGKAIETYESLLKIWPKRVSVLEDIAKLYRKLGNYKEAIAVYNRIPDEYLKAYDQKNQQYGFNQICTWCNVGDTYRQAGNMEQAELYFKKAIKKFFAFGASYKPSPLEDAVEFYRDRGEYKKAEKLCKRMVKRAKANNHSITHLSFVYATVLFELGKTEETKKYAKIFLDDFVTSHGGMDKMLSEKRYRPMYLYDVAIMYICVGKYQQAKKYLEQIPEGKLCMTCVTCDCFEYYFGMGLIAELEGRKEEAKSFYEKAIAVKGDYPCCANHLSRL